MRTSRLEKYLETTDLRRLLTELGAQNIELVVDEIEHFTEKEGEKRDNIVLSYFGQAGVTQIVDTIVTKLIRPPKLKANARILDMGAGSGFFTTRVASKLKEHLPHASFYAMDATPAMLLTIANKTTVVTPLFGIAENILGSMRKAKQYADVPTRFDALFSTLMLHHCPDIDKVFQSIRKILNPTGKAVIVDMCTHLFTEFKEEMGDLHLGFDPSEIKEAAQKTFSKASIKKLHGICCKSSGRCAELFIATMRP
jgi:ubiquinone/menaquinone biosynthesis C-methylase UbiE